MSGSSRREAWLDGLKGFGILLVILGHVLSGYLDAWTFPEAYGSFYPVRTWIYTFCAVCLLNLLPPFIEFIWLRNRGWLLDRGTLIVLVINF